MKHISSIINRIAFLGSFILVGLAIFERLARTMGYTLLRGFYTPGRLMEIASVALFFVIALQLREIKLSLSSKGSG